jgi:hypothetical protein
MCNIHCVYSDLRAGVHHYYMKRPSWGLFYTFTFGGFFIGWLIDAFRMKRLVAEYNDNRGNQEEVFENEHFVYVLFTVVSDGGSWGNDWLVGIEL